MGVEPREGFGGSERGADETEEEESTECIDDSVCKYLWEGGSLEGNNNYCLKK